MDNSVQHQIATQNSQVLQLHQAGRYTEALALSKQTCDLAKRELRGHPETARSFNILGLVYKTQGNYARAKKYYEEALAIRRTTLGNHHPDTATSLHNLGCLYHELGDYSHAEPLLQEALAITRATVGSRHLDTATSLNGLAVLYRDRADFVRAEQYYQEALGICKCVESNHHHTAQILHNLADLYQAQDDYVRAEPLYQEALAVYRGVLGNRHPLVARSLHKLAELYQAQSDYVRAEPLYQEALAIRRYVRSNDHPETAESLNGLATLYHDQSHYARAEPLYQEALAIYRGVLGNCHRLTAGTLNNLGSLYRDRGDSAGSEHFLQEALAIYRAVGNHHDTATTLNNLALVYADIGDYIRAKSLWQEALTLHRSTVGKHHSSTITTLHNLAMLSRAQGDIVRAEPLLKEVLAITRATVGNWHPDTATSLNNLAVAYANRGDYANAIPLHQEALKIRRTVGKYHPDAAQSLHNLAISLAATGHIADALDQLQQVAAIHDHLIGEVFSYASERQRTLYLQMLRGNLHVYLSLVYHYFATSPAIVRAALDFVLQRKTLGIEALATQRDAVLGGRYPQLQPRLQELTNLRMQIAQKTLVQIAQKTVAGTSKEDPDIHQRQLDESLRRKEILESGLARQIPEMNLAQRLQAVDCQAVAEALPQGTTLLEFVYVEIGDFKAVPARGEHHWKGAHYLAFVLSAGEPDKVQMLDLGEAVIIERCITQFRAAITGKPEKGRHVKAGPAATASRDNRAGIELRRLIFDPLLPALNGRQQLLLSPDGDLSRLPFEVLPTDDGQRLIDTYHLSYVAAGRDVLRFGVRPTRKPTAPLIAADPNFDLGGGPGQCQPTAGRRSRDLDRAHLHSQQFPAILEKVIRKLTTYLNIFLKSRKKFPHIIRALTKRWESLPHFTSLPGTRLEGEHIAGMLQVQPWLQDAALEAKVKAQRSPRILHLATHGFFLEDQPYDPEKTRLMSFTGSEMDRLTGPSFESPMLRSGLALAGANTWLKGQSPPPDAEDGLLTAEDVTSLDLLDTELVVLSACETGLGDVHIGEGVLGLRRAFVLAGAKTLVMSLWTVPDEQTQELMEDFYTRLLQSQPRAEALRAAQLAMKARHPEPLYWGAFICQGKLGPLYQL